MASNRVTAGIPTLSPGKRDSITDARRNKERDRQLLKEEIGRNSATVASDGDLDITNWQQRLGTPLSSDQMEKRLARCNRHLVFEVSMADPSKVGIYVIENRDGVTEKRFVCGMGRGYMPEYSFIAPSWEKTPNPDEPGEWLYVKQFKKEIRGWRTVLMRLKTERIITQPQIDLYWPASTGNSRNWQALTN